MKKNTVNKLALYLVVVTLLAPSLAWAADLDSPAAPAEAESAVYRTDDLYNRLQSGAAGAKRGLGFAEPTAGPAAGARKTLEEIMAVAPVADNVTGAAPADVASGKTFWGLRTDGGWGLRTGTGTGGGGSTYPAPVPRSGQTTCSDVNGGTIACAGTGQDGDKQKGVALPSPRFTINMNGGNPDGTVTDNLTGLIWLANANCLETVGGVAKPALGHLSWPNALTWSNNLASGKCGLNDNSQVGDWRLPNDKELFSLVNRKYYNPALSNTAGTAKWTEGNPFSGVLSNRYWSSTTNAYNSPSAWSVYFLYGDVGSVIKTENYYPVWPVRGGQQ